MVRWKRAFLIYIILFLWLVLATSYQVSSIIVKKDRYVDNKVIFGEYNFANQTDKKIFQEGDYVEVGERHYKWTVIFSLEKPPRNYKFTPLIYFAAFSTQAYTRTDGNVSVHGGCRFYFSLYVNGEKVEEAEQVHGISFGTCRWGPRLLSIDRDHYYYLRKGSNNFTAVVTCSWWYSPANANIVGGYANYTLGPFKVIVGELKTIFGLQPGYLLPGAILLLPVSVALEIFTRRIRRKFKRITRV